MATRNIQTDYGAAGDGSTDDTQAINQAIADAQPGDSVYLPAGTYGVKKEPSPHHQGVVVFDSDDGVSDITFEGDGETTEIKLLGDSGNDAFTQVIRVIPRDSVTGLTLRQFVILGNRQAQPTTEDGHGIASNSYSDPSGNDILIKNVRVENNIGTGISLRNGGVDIEDCTVLDAANHGIAPNHPSYHGDVNIRRCLSKRSAHGDNLSYNVDFSGGSGLVEDCVLLNSNGGGSKITGDADQVTYRRVRIDGCGTNGLQKTDTGSVTLTVEDMVIKNGNDNLRIPQDTTVKLPIGNEIVSALAQYNGIKIVDNVDVQFEGVAHSKGNGKHALTGGSNTTGYVSELQHAGNPDGVDNDGSITLESEGSSPKSDIDGVPTASEVGAFTDSDTSTGSSGKAAIRTTGGLVQSTNASVDTVENQ